MRNRLSLEGLTRGVGNVGFVFTNEELKNIRAKILDNKVAAPARAGAVAPLDVCPLSTSYQPHPDHPIGFRPSR